MIVCDFHPDRAAVGVCMRCRAAICAGCCTRVEDVNHCHACLKELGARPVRKPAGSGFGSAFLLALIGLVFFGVFWAVQGALVP
jgi:hypothetical protein